MIKCGLSVVLIAINVLTFVSYDLKEYLHDKKINQNQLSSSFNFKFELKYGRTRGSRA